MTVVMYQNNTHHFQQDISIKQNHFRYYIIRYLLNGKANPLLRDCV